MMTKVAGAPMKNEVTLAIAIAFNSVILFPAFAQETIEEKLLESQEEASEQSDLYEILQNLKTSPIDLNATTFKELEIIPGLSNSLREAILQYRKRNGEYKSVDELLRIPEIDSETYDYLRELFFVRKSERRPTRLIGFDLRSRVSDRVDRPIGFSNGAYQFSPQKLYHRLRYQIGAKIQGGFLVEKDSGEKRWNDLQLYYLSVAVNSNVSMLLGHYILQVGQGLLLWGPYGFSKGADAVFPTKKRGHAFRGYTSVDENAALRGGVMQIALRNLHAIIFASKNKLDATPVSDEVISGLFATGFHRNENEMIKKDVVSEFLIGASARYLFPLQLSIGVGYYFSKYDKRIHDPDLFEERRFSLQDKQNSVMNLYWDWRFQNANIFGDAARSQNGGRALLTGVSVDFPRLRLALLFRDYGIDFQNNHGFAFADANGSTQNERGYYAGLNVKLTSATTFSAYYDIFVHPWRTFFEPLPIDGNEFLSQIEHKFRPGLRLMLRFREKQVPALKAFADQFARDKREFVETVKRQWRLQLDYEISRELRARSRLEYVSFHENRFGASEKIDEEGLLMYQEMRVRPGKSFELSARMTFFDTDSFDSAVFQYEPDLPGLVTNRSLFGEGARWYVLLKYKYGVFELAAKYSETFRDDTNETGSGADAIVGQLDRRYGLQADIKF
jgi:hypothetical protein